jgi:hypothetical protein
LIALPNEPTQPQSVLHQYCSHRNQKINRMKDYAMRLSIRIVRDAFCIACIFCIAFALQAAARGHQSLIYNVPYNADGGIGGPVRDLDRIGVRGIRLTPEAPSISLDVLGGSGSGLLYQQNDGDGGGVMGPKGNLLLLIPTPMIARRSRPETRCSSLAEQGRNRGRLHLARRDAIVAGQDL